MAREELQRLEQQRESAETELRVMLLPKDMDDERNVVMEIRAGAGGDEAGLFGAALLRMYTRFAERHGYEVSYLGLSQNELGGVKEAVFTLSGQGAFSRMKYESGVHRIQRCPPPNPRAASTPPPPRWPCCRRRMRWTLRSTRATCALTPTGPAARAASIRPDGLRRAHHPPAHRPGGHLPGRKSQLKNKEQAMKVLRSRLYEQSRPSRTRPMPSTAGARSAPGTAASASAPTTSPGPGDRPPHRPDALPDRPDHGWRPGPHH